MCMYPHKDRKDKGKRKIQRKRNSKSEVAIKSREALLEIQTKDMELHQVADNEESEDEMLPVVLEPLVKLAESNRSESHDCDREYCNHRGNEHRLGTHYIQTRPIFMAKHLGPCSNLQL